MSNNANTADRTRYVCMLGKGTVNIKVKNEIIYRGLHLKNQSNVLY